MSALTRIVETPRAEFQRTRLCVQKRRKRRDVGGSDSHHHDRLTNGNVAILNGQMDLKMPGGT